MVGAIRRGDLKLVWRTMLPSSVELYNLRVDPSESTNIAAEHPEEVLSLQQRLEELGAQATKPLFLVGQFKVVQKGMQGEPVLPFDDAASDIDYP